MNFIKMVSVWLAVAMVLGLVGVVEADCGSCGKGAAPIGVAVGHSEVDDSVKAGDEAAKQAKAALKGKNADVVLVFDCVEDQQAMLDAVAEHFDAKTIFGCSAYNAITPTTDNSPRLQLRCSSWPMISATKIADQAGNTAPGVPTKAPAITTPNTALTISSTRKMTTMNSARVRLPMTSSDSAPMDLPLWRALAHSAPKSWTPAKKIVPIVTQSTAGTQPQ